MPRTRQPKTVVIDKRTHELARSIERIMKSRGLTQSRLAEQAGVDQSHLGKFFQGTKDFAVDKIMNIVTVGDRVIIDAGPFTIGKWALVEVAGEELRLMRCEERRGARVLVGRETVELDEEIHKVLGLARARIEAL